MQAFPNRKVIYHNPYINNVFPHTVLVKGLDTHVQTLKESNKKVIEGCVKRPNLHDLLS